MTVKKAFLGILALVCLWSFAAADSYQMYFQMEGIKGDQTFQGKEGWINVLMWEWASGRSILEGKPIISITRSKYTGPPLKSVGSLEGLGVKMSKWVDKSSPDLLAVFEKKIKIPSAKLCLLSVVGDKETTVTYIFEDVIINSHAQEGNRETLTFNYGKISWR
jgi:type VI protein secretion system component Hcp